MTNIVTSSNCSVEHCAAIQEEIRAMKGGEFVWSLMKPLFVGQILYTPDNALTREIISGANATFDKMASLLDTIRVIVRTQEMLQDNFNGSESLTKLGVCVRSHLVLP